MARLLLRDLTPSTAYKIQLRAVSSNGETSKWSRRFDLLTISDTDAPDVPSWAASNAWIPNGSSFVADWLPIDQSLTQNKDFLHYELVLSDGTTSKTIKTTNTGYTLTHERNVTFFGTAATTVTAKIRSVDRDGNTSAYNTTKTAGKNPPSAVTGLTVTAGVDMLVAKWHASASREVVRYTAHASTSSSFTPSLSNQFFDGSALTATFYTSTYSPFYIAVVAYDDYGQASAPTYSAPATPISPFGADTTPPSVPTGLAGTITRQSGVAQANLSWSFTATGSDADIQSFVIKWWDDVDPTTTFLEYVDKASRSVSINLPRPFNDYHFQIASVDKLANYSAFSTSVGISGGVPGAPAAPTGVTASSPGLGSLLVSWTANTEADVTYGGYYTVEIATDSGFTTNFLSTKTGNTSLQIAGLQPGVTYYYRVKATDSGGSSGSYSTAGSLATTGLGLSLTDGNPVSSSPAATASAGIGTIFVSWPTVSNADPVTYEVHMSTTAGFTPTLGGATLIAQTPGTIVTINKDTSGAALSYASTYYFRIIAKDADTNSGNAPAAGTVSDGTIPRKAGTSDITTIIADQIGTGSLSAVTVTIASGGAIQSGNYIAGTTGYKISDTVVDIRSGAVGFNTLVAGTVTTTGLVIGAGGQIVVDSTGSIQSNNYSGTTTGWKISATGIVLNDSNSSVYAAAFKGGTFTGNNFIVGTGGAVRSSNWNGSSIGWNLSSTGLTIYSGTIYGASVQTDQLYSITSGLTTTGRTFEINSLGYAEFSGAKILGNTTLGSSSATTHWIQSYNYDASTSTGWRIDAGGNAYINTLQVGSATNGLLARFGGSYGMIEFNTSGATGRLYGQGATGGLAHLLISGVYQLTLFDTSGSGGHLVADGYVSAGTQVQTPQVTNGSSALVLTGNPVRLTTSNLDVNGNNINGVTNINSSGTITFGPSNGSVVVSGASNINGRVGMNPSSGSNATLVFDGNRIIVANDNYNTATPTSSNTKNLISNNLTCLGTFTNTSDERLKKYISPIDDAIGIMSKIEYRRFQMKKGDGSWKYGVIAQELEDVLPEAVSKVNPDQEDSHLAVDYIMLGNVTGAAVKELIVELDILRKRVTELEGK